MSVDRSTLKAPGRSIFGSDLTLTAALGIIAANLDGEVGDGAHTHPVRARPVEDAATVEAVTGAYAAKYGDSPYVQPLMTEEAADATLRLEPRP